MKKLSKKWLINEVCEKAEINDIDFGHGFDTMLAVLHGFTREEIARFFNDCVASGDVSKLNQELYPL